MNLGENIKKARKAAGVTQKELAEQISVSDKTISKWETGKGLPDIAIIEDLAKSLGVSIAELLTGDLRENENPSGNMKKILFYVCPICGYVMAGNLVPERCPVCGGPSRQYEKFE